jgi:hypothetical protein
VGGVYCRQISPRDPPKHSKAFTAVDVCVSRWYYYSITVPRQHAGTTHLQVENTTMLGHNDSHLFPVTLGASLVMSADHLRKAQINFEILKTAWHVLKDSNSLSLTPRTRSATIHEVVTLRLTTSYVANI